MGENHLYRQLTRTLRAGQDSVFARLPGGREIPYSEFFDGALRMAQVLRELGVEPGDRVAAQTEKSIEALQLYVGSVAAGSVFLPLNPASTEAEVAHFIQDAQPAAFVCDPSREGAAGAAASAAGARNILTMDGQGQGTLIERLPKASGSFAPEPRGPGDLAAILYTSGTTGRPKGAMLTHDALGSNSQTLKEIWGFTKGDILIHALPIFHTHGLFVATNVSLMAGASIRLMPQFKAPEVLEAFRSSTALMGVPTFYTRLLAEKGLAREAASGMRLFVSGSAPLLAETHKAWRERTGHSILERYGMTETNMSASNPYEGERRPGTVGFPLPGVEIRICDPKSGAEVPQGEVGMLEVRGRNVFAGYWNMPGKTREDLRENGFFITGDLGKIDGDGYISIVGRSKDLIISGGMNVYPKEVETALDAIGRVRETAVVGAPHPDFGEAVVAFAVPEGAERPSAEQVIQAAGLRLAKYKLPKIVRYIDALPRNAMGKVQKNLLREMAAGFFKEASPPGE